MGDLMYKYDQYDQAMVDARVAEFRDQVRRRLDGHLPEEAFRPLRLMNGLYLQLHAYMLRIAIPYGTLASHQLRKLAEISRKYDRGYGHFTTRQNLQLNWIRLEDAPDALAALAEVDMHAMQTSGNCIRNVTADHFAGAAGADVRGVDGDGAAVDEGGDGVGVDHQREDVGQAVVELAPLHLRAPQRRRVAGVRHVPPPQGGERVPVGGGDLCGEAGGAGEDEAGDEALSQWLERMIVQRALQRLREAMPLRRAVCAGSQSHRLRMAMPIGAARSPGAWTSTTSSGSDVAADRAMAGRLTTRTVWSRHARTARRPWRRSSRAWGGSSTTPTMPSTGEA